MSEDKLEGMLRLKLNKMSAARRHIVEIELKHLSGDAQREFILNLLSQ